VGTAGLELWTKPGTEEVRGLHHFGAYLYAVIGQTLYRIDTSGNATAMTGTIPYGTNTVTNGGLRPWVPVSTRTYSGPGQRSLREPE